MSVQGQPTPFPRHLLHQAPESRLDSFKTYTVAHPALKQADQAVWNALREPAGACLIFVFGPTGGGKTTLLTQIEKRLMALAPAPGGAERRPLPALRVDAVAPALNHFKWGDYYQRALCLLREPVVDYTVDDHQPIPLLRKTMVEQAPLPSRRLPDTAALRVAFEHMLTLRQPRAILIDEAEHIAKAARGSTLLDQLDHVKSLAIMTHTVHVLVGTYDLLVFRNRSAQLARRSVDVHFARYRATTEAEVRAFKSVLWAFQRNVPLEEEPDLLQHWQYCYEHTVGCVGVLKDWLTRGLADALERGAKTLSRALLERHALSVDRCEQMITIKRPVAHAFERMQQPQGDDLAGPEVGLGVFGDGAQLLIDLIEQCGDQLHGHHTALLSLRGCHASQRGRVVGRLQAQKTCPISLQSSMYAVWLVRN